MIHLIKQYKQLFTSLLFLYNSPEWPSDNVDKTTENKEDAEKKWDELANGISGWPEENETNKAIDKQAKNVADQADKNINWNDKIKEKLSWADMWEKLKILQKLVDSWDKDSGNIYNMTVLILEHKDVLNFPDNIIKTFETNWISTNDSLNTIWTYFEEQWYFFNWMRDTMWWDLFIELWEKKVLNKESWNSKLFWSDSTEWYSYYEINDPEFQLSWNSFWWVAVLNLPRNKWDINNSISSNSDFSQNTNTADYWISMANNEITHEILKEKYDFYNDTPHDWWNVESWTEWYKIPDSQQVHEFMSDVWSINTSVADLKRILWNTITAAKLSADNWNLVLKWFQGSNLQYEYSHRFMYEQIKDIFNEKWIDTLQFTKWVKLTTDISDKMIESLDSSDLKKIQSAYLNQWKVLLNEIKSINS